MRYHVGMLAPGSITRLTLEHQLVGDEAKARDQRWPLQRRVRSVQLNRNEGKTAGREAKPKPCST